MLRSVAAMTVVTALFAGTLVGGLHYMGAATYGWKTHSLPAAGFSIMLPPEWSAVSPHGKVVFHERTGRKVVATLTVVPAKGATKPKESATTKAYLRGEHVLTFATSQRFAAAYARMFQHAADSFREL
jgi:hypothetical protein